MGTGASDSDLRSPVISVISARSYAFCSSVCQPRQGNPIPPLLESAVLRNVYLYETGLVCL
jgi:hypothetical protein